MAINLTYDPSNDPETMEAEDQRDSESLEIGEKLADEQEQLLAGKYKDAEELEKAYIELQQKLGSNEKEEGEAATETVDEVSEPEDLDLENLFPDDNEAQRVFNVAAELSENGEVSKETMAAIGEMSGQEVIDAYSRIAAAGLEPEQGGNQDSEGGTTSPLTNEDIDSIQNAVGGEDAYTRMTQWAGENFTPQEIQAYDAALESGDLNQINLGLQALYYRYQDAVGYEGDMVQGKAAQAIEGFRSQAEVVRAMGDPRYEDDPAYRQDVYDKLERSNIQF